MRNVYKKVFIVSKMGSINGEYAQLIIKVHNTSGGIKKTGV